MDIQGIDTSTPGQAEFAGSKTITAIPSATTFEYAIVSATADAFAIADPIIFWTPAFINDTIVLAAPASGGEVIVIRSIKSAVTAPASGEANTGANLGDVTFGLYTGNVSEVLQFKSLVEGSNVNLVDTGNEVQINSSSGALFEEYTATSSTSPNLSATTSYLGIRNTSIAVTVDLSTGLGTGIGRKVTIKDETGGAAINNISIVHAGSTFDGAASPLVINTNFGSVTIVYDGGTNWFLI